MIYKCTPLLSTILFLFSSAAFGQYTDVINTNRPGESHAAFAVGKSVLQFETGLNGIYENYKEVDFQSYGINTEAMIRYGAFLEELEFIGHFQYQYSFLAGVPDDDLSGFRRFNLGAKYLIYDPYKHYEAKVNIFSWKANQKFEWRQLIPAVAVFAGANLNISNPYTFENDASLSPKLMLITQNVFANSYVFVTNIIADRITTDFPTYGGIATLTRGFNDRLSGFAEFQYYQSDFDFHDDMILRTGAAWLVSPAFQIDASIGASLKNTPQMLMGGIGMAWRYDTKYQDVVYRKKEPKVKSEKKKDKAKSKKRKDAIPEINEDK